MRVRIGRVCPRVGSPAAGLAAASGGRRFGLDAGGQQGCIHLEAGGEGCGLLARGGNRLADRGAFSGSGERKLGRRQGQAFRFAGGIDAGNGGAGAAAGIQRHGQFAAEAVQQLVADGIC